MERPDIALIDFEASCLPFHGFSFPIEVGLAKLDGSSRSWLIRPADAWQFWDWTDEAQSLHGISRETLERDGVEPAQVLGELSEAAQGCRVYADSELDAHWLQVLADVTLGDTPFPILFLGELFDELGCTREQVVWALAEAKRQLPREHHARDDASRLALVARLLMDRREGR